MSVLLVTMILRSGTIKTLAPESVVEDSAAKKERKSQKPPRRKSKTTGSKEAGVGAGTSQATAPVDLSCKKYSAIQHCTAALEKTHRNLPPLTLPEEPNLRKCSVCSSILKSVDKAGQPPSLLQCPQCPDAKLLCEHCLYPCSYTTDVSAATCTNNSCQLVSMLLTCDLVTELSSKVYGCPQFRACPKCHSLMLHEKGCKYVACGRCSHRYCFICLRNRKECVKDVDMYWSLACSKPRAARQRFQT